MRASTLAACAVLLFGFGTCARAGVSATLPVWPGAAPGSEHWTWHEQDLHHVHVGGRDIGTIVEDVVSPTLAAYLPDGTPRAAVIIAPGGACLALAMAAPERLALSLQRSGIAAFVLKYRLQRKTQPGPPPADLDEDVACKWGIADAVQALRVVRAHAKPWKLDPHRVGIAGFSAGGMLASATLVQADPALRPDFAALIYGAPFGAMPVLPAAQPAHAGVAAGRSTPPVFMAWAQDDPIAGAPMRRFRDALRAHGYAPEVHVYHAGGHGFAMRDQGTTSDHWLQEFQWWLADLGLAAPLRASQ